MVSAMMQTTSVKSVGRVSAVRPFSNASKPLPRVVCRPTVQALQKADDGSARGPSVSLVKLMGAAAAAQLLLLPVAGIASADLGDIIPESAKNPAARAELNQKTSNLPSISDVGDSLKQNLGFGGDPKNIGRAIDANTPDVDLTKNPKDVAKDVGRAIDRATPDLPSPGDIGRAIDRNTPDLPNVNLGSGNKPGGLGSNVDNPLPNPNQAKDALTGGGGLPNPFEAIKNAVTGGSGPDLPDPRDAASKITGKGPDVQGAASDIKSKVDQALPNVGNPLKGGGLPGSNTDLGIGGKPI